MHIPNAQTKDTQQIVNGKTSMATLSGQFIALQAFNALKITILRYELM